MMEIPVNGRSSGYILGRRRGFTAGILVALAVILAGMAAGAWFYRQLQAPGLVPLLTDAEAIALMDDKCPETLRVRVEEKKHAE